MRVRQASAARFAIDEPGVLVHSTGPLAVALNRGHDTLQRALAPGQDPLLHAD